MDVSVVIVNWNTRDILRDCLQSIYIQCDAIAFEVIVVDNSSTDGSVEMIRAEFSQVRLIENETNRGFAAANNQGLDIAIGRYVLLLNSDTVVLDHAIQKTVSFASDHPDAAVFGCRVLNPDYSLQPTGFMYPSVLNLLLSSTYLYKIFPGSKFFGREQMTWWDRNDVWKVDVVTGCFMLVRKKAIVHVGVLDENFFMYGEETDWCYRFTQAGWQVLFFPHAKIIHLGGKSSDQARGEMVVQLRVGILQFMKKHYGWLTHRVATLLVVLFFSLRLPVWILVALVNSKQREQALVRVRAYGSGIFKVLSLKV